MQKLCGIGRLARMHQIAAGKAALLAIYSFAYRSVLRYDMKMKKMVIQGRVCRQVGAAESFIDKRLALGRVTFSLDELIRESGLSAVAAKHQLRRLPGKAIRVSPRQPFFLIISPEHRAMGAPQAIWWLQDYFDWLGRPYYLALQSAASEFGSNPQALQVTQVMTDRPFRAIKVGRVQVRFFVKSNIKQTPTQQLPQAPAPLCISTPEATVFDLVQYAVRIGGMDRAAETIAPLLPKLRVRELKRALNVENAAPIAQRLGFIFEAIGAKRLADAVYDWLPDKLIAVPLYPIKNERRSFPIVERWQVLNNSDELKL
jgi:hypothetical protein